jgi:hypothetical protein
MKSQLCLSPKGLALATFCLLALAYATAVHPLTLSSLQTVPDTTATDPELSRNHIYCDGDVRASYSNIHKGWVCPTELSPTPRS